MIYAKDNLKSVLSELSYTINKFLNSSKNEFLQKEFNKMSDEQLAKYFSDYKACPCDYLNKIYEDSPHIISELHRECDFHTSEHRCNSIPAGYFTKMKRRLYDLIECIIDHNQNRINGYLDIEPYMEELVSFIVKMIFLCHNAIDDDYNVRMKKYEETPSDVCNECMVRECPDDHEDEWDDDDDLMEDDEDE